MIGHELAVEQAEAAKAHPRHQPGQRQKATGDYEAWSPDAA